MDAGSIGRGGTIGIGVGRITGTCTRVLVPGVHLIRLYHWASGRLIAQTWSSADGSYTFNGLDASELFFAVAHDRRLNMNDALNAAIADLITPEIP